jgi:hypothetical protein
MTGLASGSLWHGHVLVFRDAERSRLPVSDDLGGLERFFQLLDALLLTL